VTPARWRARSPSAKLPHKNKKTMNNYKLTNTALEKLWTTKKSAESKKAAETLQS